MKNKSIKAMSDYIFSSRYARYDKDKMRRRTWPETVDIVRDMMLIKYEKEIEQFPELKEDIIWSYDQVLDKRVLGSQRALQYGGEPTLKKMARLYNCFEKSTEFITSGGVKSFKNFSDGDVTNVLTHKGNWKKAVVKKYAKQKLNKITIGRGNAEHIIYATPEHRWFLKNGDETTDLKVGDQLLQAPNIFNFDYDTATPFEKLYWAYGFVFGDGTKVKDGGVHKHSMVRLCDHDTEYLYRFEELGFKSSSSLSLKGDIMIYTGKYLKTAPNPEIDPPNLIKAFVQGYLDADGEKNKGCKSAKYPSFNKFKTIQTSEKDHIDFIRKCFPIAGVYIVSENDYTGQITEFAPNGRKETIRFHVMNHLGKTAHSFRVKNIEYEKEDFVWCLEVENDKSFILPFGLSTGNCTSSYCDRPRFFQEAFWLLLCGCVPPDTKILTEDGVRPIKDIKIGEKVWSYNQNNDSYEFKKVLQTHDVIVNKEDNIQIKGRFGNFITSKKHPCLVYRNKKWKYIEAGNIKLGDIIRKISIDNEKEEINKDAYFVGCFLGDGCSDITKHNGRRIRLNGDNESVVKNFAELITKLSDESTNYKLDKRKEYCVDVWKVEKTLNKNNKLSLRWKELVGDLPTKKTKSIKIPEWIKKSYNKNVFISFLAGLIDADGNINDGKISITTSSKKMVDDIIEQSTIYNLYPWISEIEAQSYNSSGFTPTSNYYTVTFPILEFKNYIDFFAHNNKRRKIETYVVSTKSQHKNIVVPIDNIEEEIKYLELGHEHYNFKYQIEKYKSCRVAWYVNRNKKYSHLSMYDEVIEINDYLDINENFKDITVEENHSYICGDGSYYVLHNCGTGFSVQKHHIAKLPKIQKRTNQRVEYVIEDSIEGWSDSLGALLSSYFVRKQPFPEYFGKKIEFNFSKIRPKGSPLSSGVGKAPGSDGLRKALERIEELLERLVYGTTEPFKLKPINAYDIIMHTSDAVLSGGVRRSSTICLFSPDDEEMLNSKTGDWQLTNPQRARSNNSVVLIRNETTREQFEAIMKSVKEFGEPGFLWADNRELLVNPCVTKDTWINTKKGSKQVKDLINKEFKAIVNSKEYNSESGFWKTGTKTIFKLETKNGYEIKLTDNHKLLTSKNEWVELKNLNVGDSILLSNHNKKYWEEDKKLENIGWLIGELIGDGTFSDENAACLDFWGNTADDLANLAYEIIKENFIVRSHFNIRPQNQEGKLRLTCKAVSDEAKKYGVIKGHKFITDDIEKSPLSFQIGVLRGLFDADGSVQGNRVKGVSIRLSQSNLELLRRVQRMLMRLGIMCKIDKNRREAGLRLLPDGKSNYKEYFCKKNYELLISCDNIKKYYDIIGFNDSDKESKLISLLSGYKRNLNHKKHEDEIISIEECGIEEVYDCTIKEVHEFCANGIRAHNCCEIGFIGYETFLDENGNIQRHENGEPVFGKSGWSFCNLSEINGGKIKTEEDFEVAARAAAIIGTLQAGFTKFDYLGKVSENIVKREALLGVSITGMMENPDLLFNADMQKKMAKLVLKENERIAKMTGINPAARATCIKPSGTAALVLGTSSGIHPHHARRYFRRVQSNKDEPILQWFKMANPKAVEESVWSANKTDDVITFCVEVEKSARTKNQIDALSLLKHVKSTQKNWVMEGVRPELCTGKWLRHNVSNTIHIRDNEWDDVTKYIYDNRNYFAGVSLLSIDGDKDYAQAPNCKVYSLREITGEYGDGSLLASGLIVDGLHCFNDLWAACDCVLDIGEPLYCEQLKRIIKENPKLYEDDGLTMMTNPTLIETWLLAKVPKVKEKREWVRRAKQFAIRYFDNDIKKMCYCLKDVHNLKLWIDLNREFIDVDYTQLIEATDETKIQETIACSGGKCDIHV